LANIHEEAVASSPSIAVPILPRDRGLYLAGADTCLRVSWVVRKSGGRRNGSRDAARGEISTPPGKNHIPFLGSLKTAASIAREMLIFGADSQHPILR
jgi:hypothetical protein